MSLELAGYSPNHVHQNVVDDACRYLHEKDVESHFDEFVTSGELDSVQEFFRN